MITVIDTGRYCSRINLNRNGDKSLWGDLWAITDSVFWTRHRRWQHTTSHINTYQHAQKHTALGHLFLAWCEQVRPTRNGPWPPHSGPQARQGRGVQREPTGRAIIVIVIGRVIEMEEKEREMSRERKRETRDTRRETKMRRERCTSVITVIYRTYCFSN